MKWMFFSYPINDIKCLSVSAISPEEISLAKSSQTNFGRQWSDIWRSRSARSSKMILNWYFFDETKWENKCFSYPDRVVVVANVLAWTRKVPHLESTSYRILPQRKWRLRPVFLQPFWTCHPVWPLWWNVTM